ncbi:unnamed protein product [Echinostoma caproni]|uniref:Uncharacterized protein n=1 Tax=Echinostoma caproni TaxID=27848 RepID=A0A183BF10_9TREM|nr:unnamed protein product [Echinostoma caproni]
MNMHSQFCIRVQHAHACVHLRIQNVLTSCSPCSPISKCRPCDFARLRVCDLELAGLTEVEINRLVCRLLDLGLPTGNLLPASDNPNASPPVCGAFDRMPLSNPHRSKPLRKVSVCVFSSSESCQVHFVHFVVLISDITCFILLLMTIQLWLVAEY